MMVSRFQGLKSSTMMRKLRNSRIVKKGFGINAETFFADDLDIVIL